MIAVCRGLGLDVATLETGFVPEVERHELAGTVPPAEADRDGAPLVLHVFPSVLPMLAMRLGRRRLRGRRVIGFCNWELPVLPPAWRHVTRFVHEIWTPTRFSAAAFETLFPGRVRVVPYPLAASPPRPGPERRADWGLPPDAVVVLVSFSLASSFERKNPLAAIAAFRLAFGDRADRILLLKVAKGEHAPEDMRRLHEAAGGAANIRFETRLLPTGASHALTAASDIVLSTHRSEGFGLVPAEAMLLGRPVVATDWSGTTDFLDARSGVPIPFRLVPARDPRAVFATPGAVWADLDVEAAADALRTLAADPARRASLGKAARARALECFGDRPLRAALRANGVEVA